MYADDTILMSEYTKGLHNMLNTLSFYTEKWQFSVVISIDGMIELKGNWVYNNKILDIVDQFCFFGVLLHYMKVVNFFSYYHTQKHVI